MSDSKSNIGEEWRPVVGYEELYSVSNRGRIRRDKGMRGRCTAGRVMKCSVKPGGYLHITLSANAKRRTLTVHSIADAAFLGVRPTGQDVNHKNGVKVDNRAANLEYVTRKENQQHASRLGLRPHGEEIRLARLNDDAVREIRRRYDVDHKIKPLVEEFGVAYETINRIVRRETWKHVT